LAARRRGYW